MNDHTEELANLRAKVDQLEAMAALAFGQAQAAHHLVMSLVVLHPEKELIHNYFNSIAESASVPILFSKAPDEVVRLIEGQREATDSTLRTFLPKP